MTLKMRFISSNQGKTWVILTTCTFSAWLKMLTTITDIFDMCTSLPCLKIMNITKQWVQHVPVLGREEDT